MRELDALMRRRNLQAHADNYRVACVLAAICNVFRDSSTPPARPDDFISGKSGPDKQTPEQMLSVVKQLNAAFGGNAPGA